MVLNGATAFLVIFLSLGIRCFILSHISFVSLWKASFGSFCVINLKEQMPEHCRIVPERHVRRRRKRQQDSPAPSSQGTVQNHSIKPRQPKDGSARHCTICLHYNSMLYLDFFGPKEMVVVEQPWLRVVSTFPEALQRRVYGVN